MYQNYTYTGWHYIGKYIVTYGRYLTHGRYEISYNYSVLNNIDHHLPVYFFIIPPCYIIPFYKIDLLFLKLQIFRHTWHVRDINFFKFFKYDSYDTNLSIHDMARIVETQPLQLLWWRSVVSISYFISLVRCVQCPVQETCPTLRSVANSHLSHS